VRAAAFCSDPPRVSRPTSNRRQAGKGKVGKRTAQKRRGGGMAMKAYASFDLYLADQPALHQRLISALRRFVARTAPRLQESVKWGNGCWLAGNDPVSYVYAAEDYVQFGFFRGAALDDPKGLLCGDGQYVRHIKVKKPADIDARAFGALLRQAIR
jgi:hypothetical protein